METYVGRVSGTEIEIATDTVARTPRAKEVTAMRRRYAFGGGELAIEQDMAAMGQPLHHHLRAQLHPYKD